MDKLKEKERDKVIPGLIYILYIMRCVVSFCFYFIDRTGKDYKDSVHLPQAYITQLLLHSKFVELLNIYFENTVLGYYKIMAFSPLWV